MNKESFDAWKQLPETKDFFRYLWHCRLMTMEKWARRQFTNEDPAKTAQMNAVALGGAEVLTDMLDVDFDDIENFYQQTGGVGEFKYQARRENDDQQGVRVDPAGPA